MRRSGSHGAAATVASALVFVATLGALAETAAPHLRQAWPRTDFSKSSIDFKELKSGGPGKDGIPAIDRPKFESPSADIAAGWIKILADREPVIAVTLNGDARAYPIRILLWHEIVNDIVGGTPLAITYCPLCNASLVFERTVGGNTLDFGTTGLLRNSDLVMYDRLTESWWQQFTGEAIVGTLQGAQLKLVPSRIESFARFRERFPAGKILVPTDPSLRDYGRNPYVNYDEAGVWPFLFDGNPPPGVDAMERVIAVEVAPGKHEAWTLSALRSAGEIRRGELVLRWMPGQASPLDTGDLARGRDIGNVTVQRETPAGTVDVIYDMPFAFAFHAFRPQSPIHRAP